MFCIPASLALLRAPLISSTFVHVSVGGGKAQRAAITRTTPKQTRVGGQAAYGEP